MDMASVPASSTALAMETMSVTLGESLVMTIFSELALTCATTSAAASGQVPKTMPPSLTLGQEILISTASTPSTLSFFATSPYSSGEWPYILTITGTSYLRSSGRVCSRK